jgi:hypothetical protein
MTAKDSDVVHLVLKHGKNFQEAAFENGRGKGKARVAKVPTCTPQVKKAGGNRCGSESSNLAHAIIRRRRDLHLVFNLSLIFIPRQAKVTFTSFRSFRSCDCVEMRIRYSSYSLVEGGTHIDCAMSCIPGHMRHRPLANLAPSP